MVCTVSWVAENVQQFCVFMQARWPKMHALPHPSKPTTLTYVCRKQSRSCLCLQLTSETHACLCRKFPLSWWSEKGRLPIIRGRASLSPVKGRSSTTLNVCRMTELAGSSLLHPARAVWVCAVMPGHCRSTAHLLTRMPIYLNCSLTK